jgi:tetratricopeptide (TPR) repeat protein/transcriptional regulator with XRE-family HTH domain
VRQRDKNRQKTGVGKPKRQPNNRLKQARENRGWSVYDLAAAMSVSWRTIDRWEKGLAFPPPKMREKLCNVLELDAVALGFGPAGQARPTYFNLPFARNHYFTGRENSLEQLFGALVTSKQTGLPVAMCGLGGMGKTQLVIEYVYKHLEMYQAIFWVRGSGEDQLVADFVNIAFLLNLPEKQDSNSIRVVGAVRQWLSHHTDWLLIFDNVEDLNLLSRFLPLPGCGHVVLTTPTQIVGTRASKLELEKMDKEESVTLLLRRAKPIQLDGSFVQASAHSRENASELAQLIDGLPLALDQAGAYIEADHCGISEYLALYRARRSELLRRRGNTHSDHPASVTTTFLLAFDKINQVNPAATDLLRLCAFLQPDVIPEELITVARDLGPLLQPVVTDPVKLHDALQTLLSYSLIHITDREPNQRMLSIHRLVQAVLQDTMDDQVKQQWAERTILAVDQAYEAVGAQMVQMEESYKLIPFTTRYDPHALECSKLIKRWGLDRLESVFLLFAAGNSLRVRALYSLAEPLLQQAHSMCERVVGPEHALMVIVLSGLAYLYQETGQFDRAESLYEQALEINERLPDNDHLIIVSLNNLGQFYNHIGNYSKAQQYFERAIAFHQQVSAPEHPVNPAVLQNLSVLYLEQGQDERARVLQEQAHAIRLKQGLVDSPTLTELIHVIYLDISREDYDHAESLCRELQKILDGSQVPHMHPYRAEIFFLKAQLYSFQKKYVQAEKLYRRALHMFKTLFGPDHADIARVLVELAKLSESQKQYAQAESLYEKALVIQKKAYGLEHFMVAQTLMNIGICFQQQKRYIEAESRYKQAQKLIESTGGSEHEYMGYIFFAYISLLEEMGRWEEAVKLGQRLRLVDPVWKERWLRAYQKRIFKDERR